MDSIELFSTHKFESVWRFQGRDDLRGTLYLSPQEIKLVLSGPAENIEPLRDYIWKRDEPLTGYALTGSKLSLVDAFASGCSFYSYKPPHFASVSVFANLCIVGRHLATEDDRIPGKLWLSFPLLAEWFHHNPYNSRPNHLEVHKVDESLLDAKLPSIRSRIRSFHSIRRKLPSYRGYSSDVQVFLYFEPDDCNTAQRAVQRAFSCTGLWSIFCGAQVAPSYIFFKEEVEGDQPRDRTLVFVPLGELALPDNLHPRDVLLPFETIGDKIGSVVDTWLGEQRLPLYPVNLFLWAFRQHRRRHFDREVFQNLVIAFEALADLEGIGEPLMDKAAAKKLRDRLEPVIDQFVTEQGLQGDVEKILRDRISHLNQGTLGQKLASLKLPAEVLARFIVLKEPFLCKVVKTRNYHAHGRIRNSSGVLHDEELFRATDQLQLLVLLLLLCAVGVEADMVMARMLERLDFRQILERPLDG
jgi:ApeA N-terminal domain 1/Apea-like HEPN